LGGSREGVRYERSGEVVGGKFWGEICNWEVLGYDTLVLLTQKKNPKVLS